MRRPAGRGGRGEWLGARGRTRPRRLVIRSRAHGARDWCACACPWVCEGGRRDWRAGTWTVGFAVSDDSDSDWAAAR